MCAPASPRPPCQGPSVRRRCVDSPTAGCLARDGGPAARISRRIGGRPARRTFVRPSLRHQAPMPAQQRRRRHDEGWPACAREEPAGRREEEPVGPRQRRTAGSSPQDGKFVPKHDDFEFLEIVRPNAQGRKLQSSPKYQIKEREEHEASCVVRQPAYSTHSLPDCFTPKPETRSGFMHPSRYSREHRALQRRIRDTATSLFAEARPRSQSLHPRTLPDRAEYPRRAASVGDRTGSYFRFARHTVTDPIGARVNQHEPITALRVADRDGGLSQGPSTTRRRSS